MRWTRAQFKLILRQCHLEQNVKVKDALAKRLLSKDTKDFWKEVLTINDGSGRTSTVNGKVGYEWIASMWHEHYKNLLNSSKDISDRQFVLRQLRTSCDKAGVSIMVLRMHYLVNILYMLVIGLKCY